MRLRPRPYPLRLWSKGVSVVLGAVLLGACASKPAAPDWQANAATALKGYSSAYLSGNTRLADFEFARAKAEITSTGRPDLLALAELTRCAVRTASLEFDNCAGYQPLAQDAHADAQAYAAFLTGNWTGLNTALLPAHYRTLLIEEASADAAKPAQKHALLNAMEDPLARLISAGVLLQNARLTPQDIETATQTASSQGWRRPLLAWLGVQQKRARDAQDPATVLRIQRRIDLVLQSPQK